MSSPDPAWKTIKLIVSPQYKAIGVQTYTAVHAITDPVSVLKSVPFISASPSVRRDDLMLLFRGRKISHEDEEGTFEALMQKVQSRPWLSYSGGGFIDRGSIM